MGQRFFPLDEALGLMPGRYTPQVQETVTRLGSRMTFGEASEEIELMWGIRIPAGSVRQIVLRNGQAVNEAIEAEVAYLEEQAPEPTAKPEQLLMSVDGAMVQLTSGEWREVKTVALGEFTTEWDANKKQLKTSTHSISYFSRLAAAEAFTQAALVEWQRRGGENAQRVVAVNDGAAWIQSFIDYHCPQAIRVIDFAHSQGYLAQIGRAIYGSETPEFSHWFAKMSKQLGTKPPQRTLNDLRFLQSQHPDNPQAAEIEQAIRYLEKRQEMIDYPHFRRERVPIGSGVVESGHKVVVQRRLKQAGMRWAEANINPMLALRMGICNRIWATTWETIRTQTRAKKRRAGGLRQKTVKPQEALVVTEEDCQRLTELAQKIEGKTKARQGWKGHRWIFPHRQPLLHEN